VWELADRGTWGTIAGQPTDDSEMAPILARMLIKQHHYDPEEALEAYLFWLDSDPFDCGSTVSSGLRGHPNPDSQANGALMRISPLGIFGWRRELSLVAEYAQQDAALTHPHPVCVQANVLFAMSIASIIKRWISPHELYEQIKAWGVDMRTDVSLLKAIDNAQVSPPANYVHQQGWAIIAFQNALWQLLHAPSLEDGIVDTVMRGGDTDTNAAIAGALLGAVYGRNAVPEQWIEKLLTCRPEAGRPNVRRPRPECFWPLDAIQIAHCLAGGQQS